jgi:hypothetical protein|tara:strand:+ start:240 stop:443 length:204 start_codon:yes stop_codon:yes gene_type:complete
MKVGDLVELSAAGRKLKWMSCYRKKLGFVMQDADPRDNIYILFFRSDGTQMRRVLPRNYFKHAKVKT